MNTIKEVEARRRAILEEMGSIRSMRRGTINEQFVKVKSKLRDDAVLRGPYYVISRNEDGKTVSERLRTPEELALAQDDVKRHKKFTALCQEYEELTELLGRLEKEAGVFDKEKKLRRSRSRRTKR